MLETIKLFYQVFVFCSLLFLIYIGIISLVVELINFINYIFKPVKGGSKTISI